MMFLSLLLTISRRDFVDEDGDHYYYYEYQYYYHDYYYQYYYYYLYYDCSYASFRRD
jgi:hypothetical protein